MTTDISQNRSFASSSLSILAIFFACIWTFRTCSTTVPSELDATDLPTVSIAELKSNITEWDHQPVVIQGTVVYTWYTSFPDGGFYTIDDGTGQISILKKGLTPEQGAWIIVVIEPKALARFGETTGVAAAEIRIITIEEIMPKSKDGPLIDT